MFKQHNCITDNSGLLNAWCSVIPFKGYSVRPSVTNFGQWAVFVTRGLSINKAAGNRNWSFDTGSNTGSALRRSRLQNNWEKKYFCSRSCGIRISEEVTLTTKIKLHVFIFQIWGETQETLYISTENWQNPETSGQLGLLIDEFISDKKLSWPRRIQIFHQLGDWKLSCRWDEYEAILSRNVYYFKEQILCDLNNDEATKTRY